MPSRRSLGERITDCIHAGMLGDALGGAYERESSSELVISGPLRVSRFSDDTQLTLATCCSISDTSNVGAEGIAATFLDWYQKGKITGVGSSTLKSLRDLQMGIPWYFAGATGDRTAGNGAAMRIAPIALFADGEDPEILTTIRDVCSITHRNDEAFVGALAVAEAIWHLLDNRAPNLILESVASKLPDTLVRDRLLSLSSRRNSKISTAAAEFGSSGYVVNSVPFAIFCASKAGDADIEEILDEVVRAGGDTDTNASITGQLVGLTQGIRPQTLSKLYPISGFLESQAVIKAFAEICSQRHNKRLNQV